MLEQEAAINLMYLMELSEDPASTAQYFEELNQFLSDEGCTFFDAPLPTLLKPQFLTKEQVNRLDHVVRSISTALGKLIDLHLEDEDLRALMQFSDTENEFFAIDPGYKVPLVISRLDAFMNGYDIKFLEFNCDSPAGSSYADVIESAFKALLEKMSVLKRWQIDYVNRQEHLLNALLQCYAEFRSRHTHFPEKPTIAIVDWEDVMTASEFGLLQKFISERGYKTIVTSPQQFEIQGDKMLAAGQVIHLIYRRVITRELIDKRSEAEDFITGIKEHLACVVNPFRSFIVGNKKILAALTDERFNHIFTETERDVIASTIPWTKVLSDAKVIYQGFRVDLKPFVIDNQEKLVLKAAVSYGGKDVFLGRETDPQKWASVVDEHIGSEAWVVQEYTPIPQEMFPVIEADNVNFKLKKVNLNPWAFLGQYCGAISRISDDSIVNVSQGGGIIPTIRFKKRKRQF
jgi:glutathionylspermidine synthase